LSFQRNGRNVEKVQWPQRHTAIEKTYEGRPEG
jgi:hypothetical protein